MVLFSRMAIAATLLLASAGQPSASQLCGANQLSLPPDSSATLTGKGRCYIRTADNKPVSPLSDNERQGLIFMREEEKLAHDVYVTLAEVWDIPIFNNISQSETAHMQAMLGLLQKYEIPDPVTDEKVGAFTNTAFVDLFVPLAKKGNSNLIDALKAGSLIEETDISDLRNRIKESDHPDINQVYENLLQASYRHLRAFNRNLSSRDAVYIPLHLSQKEMDEILNAE